MESEFDAQSPSQHKGANECEEVLLPVGPLTNGGGGGGGGADGGGENCEATAGAGGDIDFFEETDPMADLNEKLAETTEMLEEELEEEEEVLEEDVVEEEEEADYEVVDGEADAEVEAEAEAEAETEAETPVERKPTQVPKKRKDAALLAAAEEKETKPSTDSTNEEAEEQPSSSNRSPNKGDQVDEEQCRVCCTKEDLISLFKMVEQQTVAEMLMTICPSVSIACKDFLPQYICNPCLDNVTIAVQLKTQCETTERELRKRLSRGKNKVRRPTGYVVIDAPVDSDPSLEEEANDDVEYKVSDEASASPDEDSDDSDFDIGSVKRKRSGRGSGGRRGRRKSAATTPASKQRERKRMGRPPTKRPLEDESSDYENGGEQKFRKFDKPTEYPCDECDQIFTRKLSLVLHKKAHSGGREPINCEVCGKQFKILGAYRTHLVKHKEDSSGHQCGKCDKVLTSKSELRRHLAEDHGEPGVLHQCHRCKRTFVSETRLARHQEGRCPGYESKQKKNDFDGFSVGKDLFKSVAPLTTTYWSDSFSD